MQFVDEASIRVEAGNGGKGALSFRREKFVPRGGPDGGDGGKGGDVILRAERSLNTLVDFRYQPLYRAAHGQAGGGSNRSGAGGEDLVVRVPVGTTVIDDETLEPLGDLASDAAEMRVARGGRGGLGNAHFKSSTNRAPRRTTPGEPGEMRRLRLQLRVLADVGLIGMPNAGKSTLLSRISASRPKIADYPFTTLSPNLGVVRVGDERSFVVADIPGLIEGAAHGAGLGTQFLRHVSRCSLLLHLVEVAPLDGSDPVANLRIVERELGEYSPALLERPIWIVLTKIDVLPADERSAFVTRFRRRLRSRERPVRAISAVEGTGLEALSGDVMQALDSHRARLAEDVAAREADADLAGRISRDVMARSLAERAARAPKRSDSGDEPDVIYRA